MNAMITDSTGQLSWVEFLQWPQRSL